MSELKETKCLYLPSTGVLVELPFHLYAEIHYDSQTESFNLDQSARTQLQAILSDPILRGRYPKAEVGDKFMGEVSPQWRDYLLEKSSEMVDGIVQAAYAIGKERIAVLLFGSVAKNLAKNRMHEDPSNIDIAVVGDFSIEEKNELLDKIRPLRTKITQDIMQRENCQCLSAGCSCELSMDNNEISTSDDYDPSQFARVGVIIQSFETVKKYGYGDVRRYMSSCAKILYDETGVWNELEDEAVAYCQLSPSLRKKLRDGKACNRELSKAQESLNLSQRFAHSTLIWDRLIQTLALS